MYSSGNKRVSFFALLICGSLILAACASPTAEVIEKEVTKEVTRIVKETVVVEEEREVTRVVKETVVKEVEVTPTPTPEPVTFDAYSTADIPTLDPQVPTAEDAVSITYIENLFVHLTNYDLETAEIVPEAATSWDISDDGLVYTFTLRTDIPWIYHNPVTGETTQEVDDEGNPRFVTGDDFVYGIKRACDPNVGSFQSSIVAPLIRGCSGVLNYGDRENIPPELVDAIAVSAPADDRLVIEMVSPAGYFLSMTPMWTLAAVPQWTIAEHGKEWIEAGHIVTSGRYLLHEWVHGVRRIIWRNPFMPADMQGEGNIERFVTDVVPDVSTGYTLWLNNEVDTSGIPQADLRAHLEQLPSEMDQIPDLAVFFISFRMDKPPFDNVQVRRAFSAAFDRATFVAEVHQGWPMKHFAPPGIFGAPPIDEVGVGYDPEYARRQLAEAGYPNCEGFSQVKLLGYSSQGTLNWIEYAQAQWEENLGCNTDLIQIEQRPFDELLEATAADAPVEEAPHMWTLGWGPKYADENNWVGDALWCESPDNRQGRTCNEIDDLIVEAREEPDPERRIKLYREIEDKFFGRGGEFPFFPIWVRTGFTARHTWLDRIPALFGGDQWYTWTIDWAAKQAAQRK